MFSFFTYQKYGDFPVLCKRLPEGNNMETHGNMCRSIFLPKGTGLCDFCMREEEIRQASAVYELAAMGAFIQHRPFGGMAIQHFFGIPLW